MKRFIAILLIFSLVLSLSANVLAAESEVEVLSATVDEIAQEPESEEPIGNLDANQQNAESENATPVESEEESLLEESAYSDEQIEGSDEDSIAEESAEDSDLTNVRGQKFFKDSAAE